MQVKIADFGFARELEDGVLATSSVGTPATEAPEISTKSYNHQVDIWSLGIIYYELLTGFHPFSLNNKTDLKEKIN